MQIKTYQEAVEYLESFSKPIVFRKISLEQAYVKDPLDRMRKFLELLGNPQEKFKSIQVSGTSGKGSTAYLISHILTQAGYKVGLAISPHLVKINERIQINKIQNKQMLEPIFDGDFIQTLNEVIPAIEQMKQTEEGEPSYFEITMAMSFLYFAKQKVDIAVVEVGIEGKYDASNTLNPFIAVLTNISLDHTDTLGSTVEEITREAVSIISKTQNLKKQIVVTGSRNPSVVKIIKEKCREKKAQLFLLNRDFGFKIQKETDKGSEFDFESRDSSHAFEITDLRLSMRGEYQIENAAVAIETIFQLRKFGFSISEEHIKKALSTAYFPGRFEVLTLPVIASTAKQSRNLKKIATSPSAPRNDRTLILDGAHNPVKMKAFITSLEKLYPKHKKVFVIAFKGNKDMSGMLSEILSSADTIIVTEFKDSSMGYVSTGATDVKSIKDQAVKISQKTKLKISTQKDPKKALEKALALCHSERSEESLTTSMAIVTGSLYLIGEIKALLIQNNIK